MSEPAKVEDLLLHAHRVARPRMPGVVERFWSCNRCQGQGVVREKVGYSVGGRNLVVDAVARCRCKAGERQSPSIALCSDAFWYGLSAEEAEDRASREAAADFYEPPEPPHRPEPKTEPTPWPGTIVEELDP